MDKNGLGVTRRWYAKSQKDSERRWLQAAGFRHPWADRAAVGLGTAFTILPAFLPPFIVNPHPLTYVYIW